MKFNGVFPALITPFNEKDQINWSALEEIIERNIEKGVEGFYLCGTSGECYLLDLEERKELLEQVVKLVDQRAKVIVNIGELSTKKALDLGKHAEGQDVAAISSIPPIYYSYSQQELNTYYQQLGNEVDKPLILYNIPGMSGVHFSNDDLDQLFANPKIIGMKHTSYDLYQFETVRSSHPELDLFIGHDELLLPALSVGANAGIFSTGNFMAEELIALKACYDAGELKEAAYHQAKINQIVAVLIKVGVFKGIKAALTLQGIDAGECRAPASALTPTEFDSVKDVLKLLN
ncbi:N-acetylneuraminate lyase [Enterococcus sp. AZ135]|uniref:dihydrodipicolinate synthase family protein n=1 Tax=unclassified Enterococcus TaxID=2608891 RepID=UPI003F2346DF